MRRRALLAVPALLAGPAALGRAPDSRLDLAPLRLEVKLDDTVAAGYRREVLIRWGDRVTPDAPRFAPAAPSLAAAETQFGWDGKIIGTITPPAAADGVQRALLAVAHPFVDAAMAFPGGRDRPEIAAGMQGASIVNLEKQGSRWIVVDGGFQSRRLSATTLCRISGPSAAALGEAARGVIGPMGGAATPWGTLLVTEGDPLPWLARLRGLDPAFQDARRFGWVIELDPLDPSSLPTKRTALGRRAHGDAAATQARDGRAVVYLTDRRPLGFLFRFVSREPAGPDALDTGTLAVARIEGANIRWLPLPAGAGLEPQAAAEAAGASPFDMPSGVTVSPANGRLYLACRGNAQRPPHRTDALNPRAGSAAGHIVEIVPDNEDHAAESAEARIFLLGADTMGGVRTPGPVPPTTWPEQPDKLHADARGRLWIGTDRGGRVGAAPDALFGADLAGPGRGMPLPIYGAPRAASVGGAATTPDGEALITLVRTPGAEPGASFERPSTRWPQLDPSIPPRSSVLLLARLRGGPVGG